MNANSKHCSKQGDSKKWQQQQLTLDLKTKTYMHAYNDVKL